MPSVFGEVEVKSYLLSLGIQCSLKRNPERRCDSSICTINEDQRWKIFEGCWHSFHDDCLAGRSHCFICQNHLKNVVSNLSKSENEALLQSEDQNEDEPDEECDAGSNNDDDDNGSLHAGNGTCSRNKFGICFESFE